MPEEFKAVTGEEEEEESLSATTIFKLIYDYRFLRIEHISALTARSEKRLHRRLLKLVNTSYLTAIRLPQQKHIYTSELASELRL